MPAADLASLKQALEQRIPEMGPSVSRAAEWIARNTTEVAWSRIEDVAARAKVSPATVVRAIQQSGFQSYSDFQRLVRSQLPTGSLAQKLAQESSHSGARTPIAAVVAEEKANLDQLEELLAPVIDDLVRILVDAKRVLVVATLMTVPIAEFLALHLRLLLGRVDYVDASSSEAWLHLRDLTSQDAVIGLSYPRYGEATRRFLTRALARTNGVVLITDRTGPPLPGVAFTVRLPSQSHTDYASTVAVMALRQILARYLSEAARDRVLANLDAADRMWSQLSVLRKS